MNTVVKKSKREHIKNLFSKLFNDENNYEKFNAEVAQAGRDTLVNKQGIHSSEDYLLRGDFESYGIDKYKKIAPHLFVDIPDDMRGLITFNSLLPDADRSNPALMSFRHLTPERDQEVFEAIHASSKKNSKSVMRAASALLLGCVAYSLYNATWPTLSLTREYSQYLSWGAYAQEIGAGTLAYVGQFLASIGLNSLALLGAGLLGYRYLMKPVEKLVYDFTFTNRLNGSWLNLKNDLTWYQSLPTRQGRISKKEDEHAYLRETKRFMNAVNYANGALKHEPKIKVGTYQGMMIDKGINYAPLAGTEAFIDISSFRTHFLVVGSTGVGKTETGMIPIARQFLEACYKQGKKAGVLVLDGKGVFATQVRDRLPEHLREKVYICGSGDGAFGIDILKNLTPSEVGELFQNAAISVTKSTENMKWLSGAADSIKNASEILYVAENSPKVLDLSDMWKERPYSYFSLMGHNALTTEVELRKNVTARILENSDKLPYAVVNAARNFKVFEELAKETQTSYTSNIVDVFSKISGLLADRFAHGSKSKSSTLIDLSLLDEGAFIGLAVSAAEDQQGGIVINNMVKSTAYTLAQKRDTAANRARELLSRINEEINGKSIKLISALSAITTMRGKMSNDEPGEFEAVLEFLNKNYPRHGALNAKWETFKKKEILKFIISKKDDIEKDMARYTDEVKAVAEETRVVRAKALQENPSVNAMEIFSESFEQIVKISEQTLDSSVLILIDEAHFFLTGGSSIVSDTFFLSIARSTGRTVLAATQSLEAIYAKMSEHDAAALLTNFGSKLIMQVSDPKTQDYVIRAFGTSNYDSVHVANAFANYPRLLNKYPDKAIGKVSVARNRYSFNTNMNDAFAYGNSLHVSMKDYSGGHRDQTYVYQHENNEASAKNEQHNRFVQQQSFYEEIDKSGTEKNIVNPHDVANLFFGQSFAIINRAGYKMLDIIDNNRDSMKSIN